MDCTTTTTTQAVVPPTVTTTINESMKALERMQAFMLQRSQQQSQRGVQFIASSAAWLLNCAGARDSSEAGMPQTPLAPQSTIDSDALMLALLREGAKLMALPKVHPPVITESFDLMEV